MTALNGTGLDWYSSNSPQKQNAPPPPQPNVSNDFMNLVNKEKHVFFFEIFLKKVFFFLFFAPFEGKKKKL